MNFEFQTLQYQKENFYDGKATEDKSETVESKTNKCKFELVWGIGIQPQTKNRIRKQAEMLCGFISTSFTHRILIVASSSNQYSVLLALMPSFKTFNNMYIAQTELQKKVKHHNFNLKDECFVFFYTMSQLRSFGFHVATKGANDKPDGIIGINDTSCTDEIILNLILNTLGRVPTFTTNNVHYASVPSLCFFKSAAVRSNFEEYGTYLSCDNGKTALFDGYLRDDGSLEWEQKNNWNANLSVLEVLGYKLIELRYPNAKYELAANKSILPILPLTFNRHCLFTIHPELPDGLHFNHQTGEISGIPRKEAAVGNVYTITLQSLVDKKCEIEICIAYPMLWDSPISIEGALVTGMILLLILCGIFLVFTFHL